MRPVRLGLWSAEGTLDGGAAPEATVATTAAGKKGERGGVLPRISQLEGPKGTASVAQWHECRAPTYF